MSDIHLPKNNSINFITYPDITITSSHPSTNTATQNLILYLNEIHKWAHTNNLQINPTKTTLMTPDLSKYNKPLNTPIPSPPTLLVFVQFLNLYQVVGASLMTYRQSFLMSFCLLPSYLLPPHLGLSIG